MPNPELGQSPETAERKAKIDAFKRGWIVPFKNLKSILESLESDPRKLRTFPINPEVLDQIQEARNLKLTLNKMYDAAHEAFYELEEVDQNESQLSLLESANRQIRERVVELQKIEQDITENYQIFLLRKQVLDLEDQFDALQAGATLDEWRTLLNDVLAQKKELVAFSGKPEVRMELTAEVRQLEQKIRDQIQKAETIDKSEQEKKIREKEIEAFLSTHPEITQVRQFIYDAELALAPHTLGIDDLKRMMDEAAQWLTKIRLLGESNYTVKGLKEWLNSEIEGPLSRLKHQIELSLSDIQTEQRKKQTKQEADFYSRHQSKLEDLLIEGQSIKSELQSGCSQERLQELVTIIDDRVNVLGSIMVDAKFDGNFFNEIQSKYGKIFLNLKQEVQSIMLKEKEDFLTPRNSFERYLVENLQFPRERLRGKTEKEIIENWQLKRSFLITNMISSAVQAGSFELRQLGAVNQNIEMNGKVLSVMNLTGGALASLPDSERTIAESVVGEIRGDIELLDGLKTWSEEYKEAKSSFESAMSYFTTGRTKAFQSMIKGLDNLPKLAIWDSVKKEVVEDERTFSQRILEASRQILRKGRRHITDKEGRVFLDRSVVEWTSKVQPQHNEDWMYEPGTHHESKIITSVPGNPVPGLYPNDPGANTTLIEKNVDVIVKESQSDKLNAALPPHLDSIFGKAAFEYADAFLKYNFEDAVQDNLFTSDTSSPKVLGVNLFSTLLHVQEYVNKLFANKGKNPALQGGKSPWTNQHLTGFIKKPFTGMLDLLSHGNRTAVEWIMDPTTTKWRSNGTEKGVFPEEISKDFTDTWLVSISRGLTLMSKLASVEGKGKLSFRDLILFKFGEGFFKGRGMYGEFEQFISVLSRYHCDAEISIKMMVNQDKLGLKDETGQNLEYRTKLLAELPKDVVVVNFMDEKGNPLWILEQDGVYKQVPAGTPGARNVTGQRNSLSLLFENYQVTKEELGQFFSGKQTNEHPIVSSEWNLVDKNQNVILQDELTKNPDNYTVKFAQLTYRLNTNAMTQNDLKQLYEKELWQDVVKKYVSATAFGAICRNNMEQNMPPEDVDGFSCLVSPEFKERADHGELEGPYGELKYKLAEAAKLEGLKREPGEITPHDLFYYNQVFLVQRLMGIKVSIGELAHEGAKIVAGKSGKGGH